VIELQRVNQFVLRKQHLAADSRLEDIVRIASDVGGLHATSATTPYLSLLARCHAFTREQLETELYERRTLAKVRCVRGTIYIHPREFIPVAFAATSRASESLSVRYLEFSGVSQADYQRTSRAILELLHGREMPAAAIRRELQSDSQISTVINLMCDQGLLVRARPDKGWRDGHHRYAVFSEYLPGLDLTAWSEKEASARLVRHYLQAFGPASERDVAWWTGFTRSRVRAALTELRDELAQIEIRELAGQWLLLEDEVELLQKTRRGREPAVNLLPILDPYLMGYRERARWLDEAHTANVFDRAGNATSVILVDGRAAGVWDVASAAELCIKLFLFERMPQRVLDRIRAEAQRLGRFLLEQDVSVRQVREMLPLPQRNAGGFMSPLRDARD